MSVGDIESLAYVLTVNRLVGDGKLKAVRDYVKKYGSIGLPAIAALGVFGGQAGRQDEL